MKLAIPIFWKNASPLEKRTYSTIIMLILAILFIVIGSYIPLSQENVNALNDYRNQTVDSTMVNFWFATGSIFLNNFIICLLMFIPVVGPIMGLSIILNTGIIFNAMATAAGYPTILYISNLILSPVFWLEFFAYSIAMAESIWILRRILQGRWRELKITGILIGICAILLLIGALVEAWPYFF